MNDYEQTLTRLAPRITDRDRQILAGLWEHNVMTTHHLRRIYFPEAGPRRARSRILTLHRYGLTNRFRRHAHDRNAPDHWILSPTGAVLVALGQDKEPDALNFRSDRALALAHSARLDHILGLAETRARFLESAREVGARLRHWYGERECERRWGRHIRPDAYVHWEQGATNMDAFVEYDTGTETLTQLKNKMPGYARLARESKMASIVLVLVHSDQREANAARKLAKDCTGTVGVYLSTHQRLALHGVAEPIWRLAHCPDRVALGDIPLAYPSGKKENF
ncbi:protein involved in plasmid replication-relaxation [Nocardiopsis sp. Huas11]|uniref:replication-relaxation family protein n=1 Tax=Nocardiopsis sp. Huas11 TaxID=2183912 RepID=UPI000EB3A126|nr:replication-relaxation family protein [Nocardiopsis sp. Huas11]RKS10254.1 protein involved in plasmid replication-relaxation [Nocardiopsis sp. Huas11]